MILWWGQFDRKDSIFWNQEYSLKIQLFHGKNLPSSRRNTGNILRLLKLRFISRDVRITRWRKWRGWNLRGCLPCLICPSIFSKLASSIPPLDVAFLITDWGSGGIGNRIRIIVSKQTFDGKLTPMPSILSISSEQFNWNLEFFHTKMTFSNKNWIFGQECFWPENAQKWQLNPIWPFLAGKAISFEISDLLKNWCQLKIDNQSVNPLPKTVRVYRICDVMT